LKSHPEFLLTTLGKEEESSLRKGGKPGKMVIHNSSVVCMRGLGMNAGILVLTLCLERWSIAIEAFTFQGNRLFSLWTLV
jgi:hypothetical protein